MAVSVLFSFWGVIVNSVRLRVVFVVLRCYAVVAVAVDVAFGVS